MEEKISCPRVLERKCGGWLAVSSAADTLQIGVTAASEIEARQRFREVRERWQEILDGPRETMDYYSEVGN